MQYWIVRESCALTERELKFNADTRTQYVRVKITETAITQAGHQQRGILAFSADTVWQMQ
ncbi:hypothetical protein [Yersinia similis]|uniref:hypothetical protein n=1 Tax=Yersinia similis TaxID=367190 RepID=UPI0011A1A9BD|nr:hypothetical protein [Yersinia similis]